MTDGEGRASEAKRTAHVQDPKMTREHGVLTGQKTFTIAGMMFTVLFTV